MSHEKKEAKKDDIDKDDLGKKLEECEKLKDEYLAGWQRARADFLNYKKDELERIESLISFANTGLMLKILPILDNFELAARQNFPSENLSGQEKKEKERIIQGFLQIKTQLENLLKSQGIEEIVSLGQKFDPKLHEVVEEIEADDKEPGIIIEEIQKGYMCVGQVLRPAKVKINK